MTFKLPTDQHEPLGRATRGKYRVCFRLGESAVNKLNRSFLSTLPIENRPGDF
jgi:hypothetical protein